MANRRLASADVQPASFAFTPANENWASQQIAKYPEGRQASAVIALLMKAQEQAGGWVPQKAIELIAQKLDMPYIRVMEVVTFYTMFNLEPVGRFQIQLCGTTPCQLRGSDELKKLLKTRIGDEKHVSSDGMFSWMEVECLGACCNAPMIQINNDRYYEDLNPQSLNQLMDDLAAGRLVKAGSQNGRVSSEPQDAAVTLQDKSLYNGSVVGAWRKRFEQVSPAAEAKAETESQTTTQRAATEPKIAKPDAGRATERLASDAPAQRAASGEEPVKPSDQKSASDPAQAIRLDKE